MPALVQDADDRLGEHRHHDGGRREEQRDLANPDRDGVGERVQIAARREPRKGREEHRRDRDGEDSLRQHVDEERLLNRRRREQRIDEASGEERVDDRVDVDQAEPERDRNHQLQHAAHGRIAPVEHDLQPLLPTLEAAQPRERQEHLNDGRDEDRARVDVELRVDAVHLRDADHEPDDDREVPEDRGDRGDREVVVAVEDPDDDPGGAEQRHDREEESREADGEARVVSRLAEDPEHPRGDEHEQRGQRRQAEEHQPEEARGDPPGALALAPFEQVAEDRHERRRERCIGDERTHEIRQLEGDGEGVDPPCRTEVVGRDHLADEAENAREPGCDAEDRRRDSQPTRYGGLLLGGRRFRRRRVERRRPRRSRESPTSRHRPGPTRAYPWRGGARCAPGAAPRARGLVRRRPLRSSIRRGSASLSAPAPSSVCGHFLAYAEHQAAEEARPDRR